LKIKSTRLQLRLFANAPSFMSL